ncbi:FecCD family ABC transporter permease [Pleionea sediminis]|uniref:FecCD family ABC transporter permease n=1 Tax=Pleionea sediminis TaxID=2569479 RepID=UPI00197C9AF8|nr:iron ABC transporter permease [Pleionea sediminis]
MSLLTVKRQQGFSLQYALLITGSVFFLIGTFLFATASGNVDITFAQVIDAIFCEENCQVSNLQQKIIWEIRLPRILMALLTGAGLSITGAVLQSVTRNPLADPYLFGISSGSALGAVVAMALIPAAVLSITFGALIGGAVSVALMLILAGRSASHVERLLLAGVAVSFMLSAFTSLILYYSNPQIAAQMLFWMMGSFSNSQWNSLVMPMTMVTIGFLIFLVFRRWLTAIQAGEESAHTLGIPVSRLRLMMLIVCSAITAVLVAHVGGIGFVGLMIPHICRFIIGNQIHRLLILCLLLGSAFMIWVDVIARSLLENQVLPVGVVTSAVGSFFFFVILKSRSKNEFD